MLRIPPTWEEYYSSLKELPRWLRQPVSFLVESLPLLKRYRVRGVLDLGCGVGKHCVYLAKDGFDVVGVDVSKSALKIAQELTGRERLVHVPLARATMTNLPFNDSCFDAVIALSVIHHALERDIAKAVDEIHRILKKNGVFLANLVSVKDPRYGTGRKVENNTFSIPEAFEERHFEELHHFFTRREILRMLAHFGKAVVELLKDKPHYWKITATK